MNKAFVIKNKEGKYLQYFDADSDDIGFTDDLTLAILYDKNEKDIMKEAYSNMEWEYVEITIAEGDLEKQLEEKSSYLESVVEADKVNYAKHEKQLTEKDKEIERLKYQLAYYQAQVSQEEIDNFNNIMLAQTRPYEELEGKSLYEISQTYQNQIRKQICDEIRVKVEDIEHSEENEAKQSSESAIYTEELLELLNKIEKGEEVKIEDKILSLTSDLKNK